MKLIYDARGTMKRSYFSGKDPNAKLTEDNTLVNSASWGFANWVENYFISHLKNNFAPIDTILVWDGGNDYRKNLIPEYKANRKRGDENPLLVETIAQLERAIKSFSAYMGAINMQVPGVEADDVIAALVKAYPDEEKIILTVDGDLLQLNDSMTLVKFGGAEAEINDDWKGVPFHLIRLYKSMVGDSSDNYRGIHRFGPKAWDSLVEAYGIDGMEEVDRCLRTNDFSLIEECIAADGNKALSHAYANLSDWKLCYRVAGLHPNLIYAINGRKLVKPEFYTRIPSREKVMATLKAMRCSHALSDLEPWLGTQSLVTADNYASAIVHFEERLGDGPFVAYDYESFDTLKHPGFAKAQSAGSRASEGSYVDVLSQEITGASFTYGNNLQHTIYISIAHKDTNNCNKPQLIRALVSANRRELFAHNANFEIQVGDQSLDWAPECVSDTRILFSHVDENTEHGLKFLSGAHLNYKQTSYKELMEACGASDMSEVTGEQVLAYGCDDAVCTAHLAKLGNLICRLEGSYPFLKNEYLSAYPLVSAFETGIRIDYDKLEELRKKDADYVEKGMRTIRSLLEEHCTERSKRGALALQEADGDNLIALWRESGESLDKAKSLLAEQVIEWENASDYKPYREYREEWEFIPTLAKLSMVAKELEVSTPLESVSKKGISDWICECKERGLSKQGREFVDKVGAAAHLFSRRAGQEYEELKDFCCEVMYEYGKVKHEGDELNLNSPKQMTELLYCKLRLPIRKRTKVQRDSRRDKLDLLGSPGTDETAMKMAIAEDLPPDDWRKELLETLIEVKACLTRESLYWAPYPHWKHPRDGVMHAGIRNCGTVTRRPTGGNPNILQVSKGEVREIFLPRYDDHVICALDFNGQELRITGSEANDPVLIDCYTGLGTAVGEDGIERAIIKDVHSITATLFAEAVFMRELGTRDVDLSYEGFRTMLKGKEEKLAKVAALCRKMAKAVNFLIIYGGGPSTLAINIGILIKFAEEIMELVFEGYPRLRPWQRETIAFAERRGFVHTAFGTRKHLTADIVSRDGGKKSRAERQAINQTIQGCAADILKRVLAEAWTTRLFHDTGARLIAPVYDEVVSSVPVSSAFEYCSRLQDLMNLTPPGHKIPMMAEVSIGPNWGSVIELGARPSEKAVIECIEGFRKGATK